MALRPVALLVLGTRPEAIKLAPVVRALRAARDFRVVVCATAQHRELLDRALRAFHLRPDIDLDLMRVAQSPASFLPTALEALRAVIERLRPDVAVVQGDTASALAGALSAYYAGVPVAHVEAGLRTYDLSAPFPEEGHRRLVAEIASLHLAPTEAARAALIRGGASRASILVTGNPGVDAVMAADRLLKSSVDWRARLRRRFPWALGGRPLALATVHRRENLGAPLERIAAGLKLIAERGEAEVVLPVHPNPDVSNALRRGLGGVPGVRLLEPLNYVECVWLLRRATLVVTDSGGLQEEAATLGVPALVLRDATERPEGVEAGVAALVGSDPVRIAGTALAVLRDPAVRNWMARPLPLYGRGDAGVQIAQALAERFGGRALTGTERAAA